MIKELVQGLYRSSADRPLYHYTSLAGVKGIVDTGVLRATGIRYLSDSQEMLHTVNQLLLESSFLEGFGKPSPELFIQFQQWVSHRLTAGHLLFVGCFTTNGNLLSQWRSYTPPGKGVSLGFDSSKLRSSAIQQGWKIGKCIYEQAKKAEILEEIMCKIVSLAEIKGENTDPSKRHPKNSFHDIFEEIEPDLLQVAALLKHPSFHEEEEWRIVSPVISNYVEADIHYREGPSMLVPFMNFELPRAPDRRIDLEHVVLGPTPNQNISMESLSNYLSKAGASPRKDLEYCRVPYRTW